MKPQKKKRTFRRFSAAHDKARKDAARRAAMLNRWWPPRGPCAFCDCGDARHRIFDEIRGRQRAGDSLKTLARDFRVSKGAIKAVLGMEEKE